MHKRNGAAHSAKSETALIETTSQNFDGFSPRLWRVGLPKRYPVQMLPLRTDWRIFRTRMITPITGSTPNAGEAPRRSTSSLGASFSDHLVDTRLFRRSRKVRCIKRRHFIPIIDSLLGPPKMRPRDRSNRLLDVCANTQRSGEERSKVFRVRPKSRIQRLKGIRICIPDTL